MAEQLKTTEVEVWVLVDGEGNAVASCTEDALADLYDSDIGNGPETPRRLVKVVLTVPLATTVVLTGTVPAEGECSLSVA